MSPAKDTLITLLLLGVGGILLLAGVIGFFISQKLYGYLVSTSLFLFGFLMIFTFINLDKSSTVVFNPRTETIQFQIAEQESLEFSYGSFENFFLTNIVTHSRNTTRVKYLLFLTKNDGAQYWVDTFTSLEDLIKSLQVLQKYIQIPIDAIPSLADLKSNIKREYSYQKENISTQVSPYLKESVQDGYTKLAFTRIYTLSAIFTLVLVGLLFFCVFSTIAVKIIQSESYFALLVFILFATVFLLVFSGILLINSRNVNLLYNFRELKIQYFFPMLSFLNKEITIPKEEIQAIQVERAEHGWFQFSIAFKNPIQIAEGFYNLVYTASPLGNYLNEDKENRYYKTFAKQDKLVLWILSGTKKNVARYSDLYYIEQKLQNELRIQEEPDF